MSKLYTTKEFAELSKVTVNTVKLWLKQGKIKGEKIGKSWRITSDIPQTSIDRNEYLRQMDDAINNGDTEMAHGLADDILCNLLIELGYQDVVDKYYDVSKWHA